MYHEMNKNELVRRSYSGDKKMNIESLRVNERKRVRASEWIERMHFQLLELKILILSFTKG